ncbi:cytochrome P450 71D9-like [Tripterygium wilfordii]|uniref:cytochrome P450 71D9-like n=1 Tax=Tripterygium wilfordii TaxID=458696 RepID=UPI0018F81154|nr:cytochrome P450 71D9-like [Tripterygium wilfordii]
MDVLQFPIFSILLVSFIFFTFMVLKVWKRFEPNESTSNRAPGPWKLPIIGNLHQLVGSDPPHHILRDLAKKNGPLMHLQLGEVHILVVSSAEYAEEVMKTHDVVFASRPQINSLRVITYGYKTMSFSPYGGYWRQLRKICAQELLSAKRVQSYRSIREQETSKLIQRIFSEAGTSINLTKKVYSSICTLTSRLAFSDESKYQEEFISAMKDAIKITSGFNIGDLFPSMKFLQLICGASSKIEKLHKQSNRIIGSILDEHKKKRNTRKCEGKCEENEDLVDVLLKYQEKGDHEFPLSMDEIKAVIGDIYVGGTETSATTVDWAMAEMIKNPRVMEKAQAEVRQVFDTRGRVDETGIPELKYLKLVIKETLRLHPTTPLLVPRENSENCKINGYVIPAKTRVIVNAWAIGRDPKYWPHEPETFYPERFLDNPIDYKGTNFKYIPFGAGRRMCPGMTFGLANVELPLSQFLYYFDWKLSDGLIPEDLNMAEEFAATVSRKEDLFLIPSPRRPPPAIN